MGDMTTKYQSIQNALNPEQKEIQHVNSLDVNKMNDKELYDFGDALISLNAKKAFTKLLFDNKKYSGVEKYSFDNYFKPNTRATISSSKDDGRAFTSGMYEPALVPTPKIATDDGRNYSTNWGRTGGLRRKKRSTRRKKRRGKKTRKYRRKY